MMLLLEEDERLVAGSIDIVEEEIDRLRISADTVEWGKVHIYLETER